VALDVIVSKFHNAMADILVATARRLSRRTGLRKVAMSGGVFQNGHLRTRAREGLEEAGLRVFTNERLPVNDLNIAWGQYYVSGGSRKG
jgi:hydrogenase maturation protein HypF